MFAKTFRGGVHPAGHKELTGGKPIQRFTPKGDLVYPLSQHIGKPAIPVVKKNDPVQVGQLIAKADGFMSANIISSASGKVKAIEPRMTTAGVVAQCIVIENDGAFTRAQGEGKPCDPKTLTNEEIIQKVMDAGIVGFGGAGFPTHVKLSPKHPEEIDTIIANGAECEPYITCDERLMIEHPEWVAAGLQVVLQLFPKARGMVAIEDNKPEAIRAMEIATANDPRITVVPLHTKFPQGGERGLIRALTGRKLTVQDIPANLGCIVDNVATLTAIYHAVCLNEHFSEKGFTVTGDCVANPGNFLVPVGTNIAELLEAAGGLVKEPKKVIIGGPMMGMAITNLNRPIAKSYNALVCMSEDEVEQAEEQMTACLRCGKCVRVCPMGLVPQMLAKAAEKKDLAQFEKLHGMACVECGCCTYACPAKRPLMQLFKVTRTAIRAEKAKGAK